MAETVAVSESEYPYWNLEMIVTKKALGIEWLQMELLSSCPEFLVVLSTV
jgi:hypothetical protein